MAKQFYDRLIVCCVILILVGFMFDLNQRSQYGFPLLLAGGAALAAVLLARSRMMRRATLIGFLVGAALSVAWGIEGVAHELAYRSSHPSEGFCGMGMMGALLAIFIGGPVCGSLVAGVTATVTALCRVVSADKSAAAPTQ